MPDIRGTSGPAALISATMAVVGPTNGTVLSLTQTLGSALSNPGGGPARHDYRGASSRIDAQLYVQGCLLLLARTGCCSAQHYRREPDVHHPADPSQRGRSRDPRGGGECHESEVAAAV